jgi:site-specific DNA recombinase
VPNAAAIYARISSDPDGDQLGVTRQVQDCVALANLRGWAVLDQYVDDDRSAYSGKARPEYQRMLDDMRAGVVDAVIVWHLDRLHRQPKELEAFFEVCDAANLIHLATVQGDINLASDDGRFHARILGAVARKESDDKSRRIRRKHQEMALAGKPAGGGTRPFGYRPDRITVDPIEAGAIREAVARIRAGDSLRSIATDWNGRDVRTVRGGPWSTHVLKRMLIGARLSGQRSLHGSIAAPGQWDAIITPAETAQLRAILTNPDRRTNRTVRRYLLAGGLLRCALCDAVLVARPNGRGDRRYLCAKGPGFHGCGGIAIMAEPLEHLIAEAVLYRLDTPELAAALAGHARADSESAAAQDSVTADQAQLEELAGAYGQRRITFPEFLAAREPIEARIESARRRIARATRAAAIEDYVGQSDRLRTAWANLPLNRQRAIVASVLDRAIIGPAVRGRTLFDPGRVAPIWRV